MIFDLFIYLGIHGRTCGSELVDQANSFHISIKERLNIEAMNLELLDFNNLQCMSKFLLLYTNFL